jgi:hypothetical protein
MKKGILFCIAAVLLATVMLAGPAFAAGEKGDDAWYFDLAPFYLWAPSISGDLGVGPIEQELDISFSDIFDNLDFVLTGHFEARKRNYGLIFNLDYLNLGVGQTTAAGPEVELDYKTVIVEFDGFYRIMRDAHAFDLLAWLRYTKQDTTLSVKPGPSAGLDESWWDPIVGARWQFGFADGWSLSARGDIGGFGVGTDFTWQLAGIVQWQPWKNVALIAGYRALDQDYEEGRFVDRYKWDATMQGPVLGVNFRW